ncbi:MAG: zinc metallopeptidase [Clostridia bacterium]|nr:zinc metallopeptidase [Clostridia bacterium]
MFFYIDWLYIILVLPAVILSLWASARVNSTFKKYSQIHSLSGLTGAEVARRILYENGLYDVKIEQTHGHLTDHYDPRTNVVRLSESTYSSTSSAAIGVAAHEVGHAIQHARNYIPLKLRNAIVPVTNIGAKLSMPLILLGIVLSAFGPYFAYLAYFGVACFSLCALFQLLTLPTEFNASRRALKAIDECGILDREEMAGARRVLSAAAMTYVAALAVTLAQLLRLVLIVGSLNNRRR